MNSLPAEDFIRQFVSAYGESWNEAFGNLTHERPCAKHMAEFIDDLEMYGQQEPVYVDEDGCVIEGNKVVLAQYVLGNDINFVTGSEPSFDAQHLYVVSFDIDYGSRNVLYNHPLDFLSFRLGDHWVYPVDMDSDKDGTYAIMYNPEGSKSLYEMEASITTRLKNLAGIGILGYSVDEVQPVDEDAGEW